MGKGSETGCSLGVVSEWAIWLVTKCLDVNEGKDTASRLVFGIEEGIEGQILLTSFQKSQGWHPSQC